MHRFTQAVPLLALLSLVALAASSSPAAAQFQTDDEPAPARPRLLVERGGFVPGRVNTVAVTFDIDPGWHTYWPGHNDTGLATTVQLTLPAGYAAGEPIWPAPHRHVSAGGILDYVHERGEATILIPVAVPLKARPGESVAISADVEWLVCREACIPGWQTLTERVPVLERAAANNDRGEAIEDRPTSEPRPTDDADADRSSADDRLIAEARARVPKPLTENIKDVRVRWDGEELVIRVSGEPKKIAFYPHESGRRFEGLLKQGESDRGILRLRAQAGSDDPVRGVLAIEPRGDGPRRWYRIEPGPVDE